MVVKLLTSCSLGTGGVGPSASDASDSLGGGLASELGGPRELDGLVCDVSGTSFATSVTSNDDDDDDDTAPVVVRYLLRGDPEIEFEDK